MGGFGVSEATRLLRELAERLRRIEADVAEAGRLLGELSEALAAEDLGPGEPGREVRWMGVGQAAKILGVQEVSVRLAARHGLIPHDLKRSGKGGGATGQYLFSDEDLARVAFRITELVKIARRLDDAYLNKWVQPKEAAMLAGVSLDEIRAWAINGELRSRDGGRRGPEVSVEDLKALVIRQIEEQG